MAWWMKLSNLVILSVLCSSNVSFATVADASNRSPRYLMSYPPCPEVEYNYCPDETILCQMELDEYIDFIISRIFSSSSPVNQKL